MLRRLRFAAVLGLASAAQLFCPPARAAMVHLRVDPALTQIVASVDEPMVRIRGAASGNFAVLSGEIDGDPANPAVSGRATIVIDAASYRSGDAARDLKVTRDTLQTARFPLITFVSTRIENFKPDADGDEATATLVGNLTLHGVTREVRVPIDATFSAGHRLTTDGEFSLDFTAFGIAPPSLLFGALRSGTTALLNFRVVAAPANRLSPPPQ